MKNPEFKFGSMTVFALNPKYTLDNFIVSPCNELAHASAVAIVGGDESHNPFFIYGISGSGKTHLIQSMGNEFEKRGKKVLCLDAYGFMHDFISVLKERPDAGQYFISVFLDYDVLIFDDLKCLSGKPKTQEEIFMLFKNLVEAEKMLILSSSKEPYKNLPMFTDYFCNNFESGIIINMARPTAIPRFDCEKPTKA